MDSIINTSTSSYGLSDDDESDDTIYDTEDEAFSEPIPANFSPTPGQNVVPGQPINFDVNLSDRSPSMPLCLVLKHVQQK